MTQGHATSPTAFQQTGPEPVGSPRVLLFQHIPKTAGTSLRYALEGLYPPAERMYLYDRQDLDRAVDPHRFGELPLHERAQLRLVMGHFPYGIHHAVPGPSRYVTMLRHPVDRVASLYFHFKLLAQPRPGSRAAEERQSIARDNLSLEDWVFGGRQLQVDNGMVRMIAARHGIPFGTCPDDLLTEAIEHVEAHYAAVLIRGSMAQSVEILGALAGQRLPPVGRRNVNPGRTPLHALDPRVRERILQLNDLDARLFETMAGRFPETYQRIVA